MIIVRPIKTNWQTQSFGDNKAMCKLDDKGEPVKPYIVKTIPNEGIPTGWKSLYTALGLKGHNGEDWSAYFKEPCYFPVLIEGMEWKARDATDSDGGIGVDIISKSEVTIGDYTGYIKFRFWHYHAFSVNTGDSVKFGDLIGLCDSTGASSGNHLHFSGKYCDENGIGLRKDNGYYGAFDFRLYATFINVFVLDYVKKELQINKVQVTLIDVLRRLVLLLKIQLLKAKRSFNKK